MLALFIKGFLIGFAIAAPIGPIGILCIHRSLHHGFKIGLMTGMGAALADGTYGLVAGFGLTAVSGLLLTEQYWIRVIGGLFLIYLGITLIRSKPQIHRNKSDHEKSALHACATTYFLTLASPVTILAFMAVFAGLGIGTTHTDHAHALALVFGIMSGSALWWLILSGTVTFILHKRISTSFMQKINWLSGGIILTFGLLAVKIIV